MEVRPIKNAEELADIEAKMRDAQIEHGVEVIIAELSGVGTIVLLKNKGGTGRLPEFGYLIAEAVDFLLEGSVPATSISEPSGKRR